MRRFIVNTWAIMGLAALIALGGSGAVAQERGEEVIGKITKVDGHKLWLKHEDGRIIPFRVTSSTEVYFRDSGDRKLFPDPTVDDLREGMGVRFVYGEGTPDRVVVHYVPSGVSRVRPGPEPAEAQRHDIRARIQSIERLGGRITADVAGRSQTFDVEDRRETRGFRRGDLVVLTVEDRSGNPVVVRIVSAELTGTVDRMDSRQRWVTIESGGRAETFDVDRRGLLDDIREGDRVLFEVEDQAGRRVVTAIRRRGQRD